MKVESMIYIYGAVCISMMVFNILYSIILKRRQPRLNSRCKVLSAQVEKQIAKIRAGQPIEGTHCAMLARKLRHVNQLIAFERVLSSMTNDRAQKAVMQEYLHQIQPVILYLAVVYKTRETMQTAYFSYVLSQYTVKRQMPIDSLQEVLLDYVKKENLYCRVNALDALYRFGDVNYVVEALVCQDDGAVFLHEKILTEGLLSFSGDHHALIDALWHMFDAFSNHTQLAILNYIRFKTSGYEKEMFSMMLDEKKDKELRLAAIRYFGRYHYEPALTPLLAFASDKEAAHWEYATVSVSALAHYDAQQVIDTLKEALHSSNWYVRYSAALSLEAHHVEYADLIDIVAGNDRYAREMMTYRLQSRKLQKVGVETT